MPLCVIPAKAGIHSPVSCPIPQGPWIPAWRRNDRIVAQGHSHSTDAHAYCVMRQKSAAFRFALDREQPLDVGLDRIPVQNQSEPLAVVIGGRVRVGLANLRTQFREDFLRFRAFLGAEDDLNEEPVAFGDQRAE